MRGSQRKSQSSDVQNSKEQRPGRLKVKKIEPNQPRKKIESIRLPQVSQKPSGLALLVRKLGKLGRDNFIRVGLLLIIAGAILAFWISRETRIQVTINAGDLELKPEAAIVLDFSERVKLLKNSLAERISSTKALLGETVAELDAAKADLAGRVQGRKLLQETIQQDETKVGELLEGTQEQLQDIWEKEFQKLDKEYEQAKSKLNSEIAAKAASLGLDFNPNQELDVPEVTVNAFRLALYNAPEDIDITTQRRWGEEKLKEWRNFEKEHQEKRLAVRDRATTVRAPVGNKVEQISERVRNIQSEMALVDGNMEMIRAEVEKFEQRVAKLQEKIQETFRPFYLDLLQIPKDYILFKYPIQSPNHLDIREIEKNRDFKPGQYQLFLQATKDGRQYWCLQPFQITSYQTTFIDIQPQHFFPAHELLEE